MAAVSSPQPLVVGETIKNTRETTPNTKQNQTYATQFTKNNSATSSSKIELVPVNIVHGEPTVEFTIEEVNAFTIEEGLHQAIILKFSYGKPDIHDLKQIIPKQFGVKGNCNVGQLEFRHILVRFDLFDDYVQALSRSTGYVKDKGEEFFFRTFQWTIGFNPREETSRAVVWISLPDLPANFFAKRSLMSIASAVGKPLAVDKATQDRTRPSTARVKVLLDLLDRHPKRVRIHILDMKSGKVIEHYQQIFYDNLPKFCTCCKHQGHDERTCHWNTVENKEDVAGGEVEGLGNLDKLQGDARDYLNARRTGQLGTEVEKDKLFEQQQITQNGEENQIGKQKNDKESNHVAMENTVRDVSMLDKGPRTVMESTLTTVPKGVNHAQVIDPLGEVSTIGTKACKIFPWEQKGNKSAGLFGHEKDMHHAEKESKAGKDAGHGGKAGDNFSVQQLKNNAVGQLALEIEKHDEESAFAFIVGSTKEKERVQQIMVKNAGHGGKEIHNAAGNVEKESATIIDDGSFGHKGNEVHQLKEKGLVGRVIDQQHAKGALAFDVDPTKEKKNGQVAAQIIDPVNISRLEDKDLMKDFVFGKLKNKDVGHLNSAIEKESTFALDGGPTVDLDSVKHSGDISTNAPITDHERSLLDALGSPKPHKSGLLCGSKTNAQKQKLTLAKRHEPCSARKLKRHEPLWMFLQDEINQKLDTNLRIASSHETKEDELIESCPEEATITGDLSPKNSEKTKVAQEITLRQLPMRAAKQKGIATSTSMRSNKSDKNDEF